MHLKRNTISGWKDFFVSDKKTWIKREKIGQWPTTRRHESVNFSRYRYVMIHNNSCQSLCVLGRRPRRPFFGRNRWILWNCYRPAAASEVKLLIVIIIIVAKFHSTKENFEFSPLISLRSQEAPVQSTFWFQVCMPQSCLTPLRFDNLAEKMTQT